ncbi:MAG: TolC family outer membrane protein [Rhodospirillales bacterium]|nr:TolC family outer membrane protein [Rhodospirillales bacterium]MCB9964657.1 TolC family outer membrane protein [Rhodospirillales bacterium]MCB9979947.1 TolC family outer membrane protein [Rhodospirillales bacterium]
MITKNGERMMTALKQKALLGTALIALAFATPASAQENPTLQTLRDAVAVGVMTNPEYNVVASSRRATDEELNQAEALYLPSVDLNADTGYEYTDDPGTRAGTGDKDESLYRYETGLTVTQLLFDGFETKYENKRQENRVLSAAHRVRETTEFVGLDIVDSYLEVLRQRQLVQIARDNIAAHYDILRQIEDGVTAGRSTQADVEQANARLARAQATESDAREALRGAEAKYRHNVGDLPKDLMVPRVPVEKLAQTVDLEVDEALVKSPTLDVMEADIRVADAEFNGTQSTLYPQVDLQLNARQGHNLGGVDGRDRSATSLLVMNWNLYRGGADMARAREFIHRVQQQKEERANAARKIEEDVRRTWASKTAAAERASAFQRQVAANTEVVSAYMDQFDLNRRTLLDVLDAQNELFVSRTNAINAHFVEMTAVYRLLAIKGDLLPTLGVEYPRESIASLK